MTRKELENDEEPQKNEEKKVYSLRNNDTESDHEAQQREDKRNKENM